ncbi:alginate export family protein [Glaciecola sp. KUL10]|uniref:alginate export family protein n=1 Tax=Glaciecola sp. (strain KUL10) TaxID=2161813 RepID=UPI000D785DCE|nr:alginate export family protein [Glaciecola sp. KUL10]GBL02900.1 hypothetical protein KUL10_01730 [Glaciecola sp. KUL10]
MQVTNLKLKLYGAITFIVLVLNNTVHAMEVDFDTAGRVRYQTINDDVRGDATAKTLKFRLNSAIDFSDKIRFFSEYDFVHGFNDESYNSVTITRNTSPIPDVEGSELNQFWLRYEFDNGLNIKLGRQLLNFDAQRHVSALEFWQNDQSMDALTFLYDNNSYLKFSYSYVDKVHRIFGDSATRQLSSKDIRFTSLDTRPVFELGNHTHNSHLINVRYQYNNYLSFSTYALLLENETAPQFSSDTFGVKFAGDYKPNTIRYLYEGEVAHQKTSSDSPWQFSGFYYRYEIGAQYKSHRISLGSEILSEDNGFAFATSLGDNHRYLGWADVFNSYVNADGIVHHLITYRGRSGKLRWRTVFNQFSSYSTGNTAGYELDFELAYRFSRKLEGNIVAARYITKGGIEGIEPSKSDLSTLTFSLKYNL